LSVECLNCGRLKTDRDMREFVADWEQGGLGIGAFRTPTSSSSISGGA
jgi:hypothetical protein